MPHLRAELNQTLLRGGQRIPRTVLARALRVLEKEMGMKRGTDVSIGFVSERKIKQLNKAYRGKDCVTDVLSFPLDPRPDSPFLGEVLINYDQARRQAAQMKHSVRDEVIFLIVHGILHVFGHDHERPADAKKMFSLQTRTLNRLGINPRI